MTTKRLWRIAAALALLTLAACGAVVVPAAAPTGAVDPTTDGARSGGSDGGGSGM